MLLNLVFATFHMLLSTCLHLEEVCNGPNLFSFYQMKPEARSVASWSTAWPASAVQWRWRWPTWCRSSTCPWTTPTTSLRWRSQTSRPTSTSWASSWTLSAPWAWRARVTIASRRRASSSTSPPRPTTTSSSWTPCSPREGCCCHASPCWGFNGPPVGNAAKSFSFFRRLAWDSRLLLDVVTGGPKLYGQDAAAADLNEERQ